MPCVISKYFLKPLLLLVLSAFLLSCHSPAASAQRPTISADAAVLMDADTGIIYFSKNAEKRKEPASITKIMTAIIALETGNLEDVVTVSPRAAGVSMGQDIGLTRGDRITLGNLLKAALMFSANDSTVAIAEHLAGSTENYLPLMNRKALILGANNTRFANTNGYHHPNHYTTARDLALIARYALRNETFARLVSTPRGTVRWLEGRERPVSNTNRLVRDNSYPGIMGVKTGSTPRAGDCLAAAAQRDGRTLIAVVLHSNNRYKDAVKMLDYGFSSVAPVSLWPAGQEITRVQVLGGVRGEVPLIAREEKMVALAVDDLAEVKMQVSAGSEIKAPVQLGQKLGEAVYTLRGQEVARVELLAGEAVPVPGLWQRIRS